METRNANQARVSTAGVPPFIAEWFAALPNVPFAEAVPEQARAALVSTDMIVGFCREGALASERVGALARPVADLFRRTYDHGMRRFVLTQDTHDPATPEFEAWPPHCLRGTAEARTIPELA